MLAWEDYFRQNTLAETRLVAKSLDREATNESDVLRKEIGGEHADVLALTQRIESLKLLVNRQESDLANFATGPTRIVPREAVTWRSTGLGKDHITDIVAARLLSIIDRSIVQRKYVLAARALYLAQAIELPPDRTANAAEKLEKRLQAWLLEGTHVSQSILHACMIVNRWSAATFVAHFLKMRLSQIREALSTENDMATAFKHIDSTLFIHHQLVSDLCKSRLSQRRITEMQEFSGEATLATHLKANHLAEAIRAFPPECYDASSEPVDNSSFLQDVSDEVQRAAARLFGTMPNVKSLTESLSTFVTQVQNSLSVDNGMGRLLDACEAPYSSEFESFIERDSRLLSNASPKSINLWKVHVHDLRTEQAQVSRLSRIAKELAPSFSERLDTLVKKTQEQLKASCEASYTEERARILEQMPDTLEKARSIVESVALLDTAYTSLGGSTFETPKAQYEQLAKLIIDRWVSEPRPERHEVSVAGTLFDLLLVMDAALEDVSWMPAVLDALRPLVLTQIRGVAPELVEATERAFKQRQTQTAKSGERDDIYADSRLLLQPLL